MTTCSISEGKPTGAGRYFAIPTRGSPTLSPGTWTKPTRAVRLSMPLKTAQSAASREIIIPPPPRASPDRAGLAECPKDTKRVFGIMSSSFGRSSGCYTPTNLRFCPTPTDDKNTSLRRRGVHSASSARNPGVEWSGVE